MIVMLIGIQAALVVPLPSGVVGEPQAVEPEVGRAGVSG